MMTLGEEFISGPHKGRMLQFVIETFTSDAVALLGAGLVISKEAEELLEHTLACVQTSHDGVKT